MTRRLLLQAFAGLTAVGASARKLMAGGGKVASSDFVAIPVKDGWSIASAVHGGPLKLSAGDRISVNFVGSTVFPKFTVELEDQNYTRGFENVQPDQPFFIAPREMVIRDLNIYCSGKPVLAHWRRTSTGPTD